MEAPAATGRPAASPESTVDCDPGAFAAAFARQPLTVRHGLSGHSLFAFDALASVADSLPGAWAHVMRADLPVVHPAPTPLVDTAAGVALRSLEASGLRVTLYHLEHVSRYRALLDACLASVAPIVTAREGPLTSQATVFAGVPGSTVPLHLDRHHNVLLQLQGTKVLTVAWFADPTEQARAVESRFDGAHPNPDRLPTVARTFRLGPGDGVYIPAYTFHWADAGDDVSVALSCGFSTPVTERAELVHRLNRKVRRLGVRPRPPGSSLRRDQAKAALFVRARRVRAGARP